MWKRDWRLDVEGHLKSRSLCGGKGLWKRGREHFCVDNLCTASNSVATWAVRDSNIMAGIVIVVDTVATVGVCALAAIISSAFRASCSNGPSDNSRICWTSAGSRLREGHGSVGEEVLEVAENFCRHIAVHGVGREEGD